MKILQNPDKWQTEINKVEAGHRNVFIAGWRPMIGWICASSLLWGMGTCSNYRNCMCFIR